MIKTAMQYHDITSYSRNSLNGHQLDWQNQPVPFKKYKGVKNIPLPVTQMPSGVPIKSVIANENRADSSGSIDINKISAILHLTYCITARSKYSNGFFYYRSAASAGALYPVEIYLMISNVDGLDDGVYHFNIMNHSLNLIREGDYSAHAGNNTVPRPEKKPLISFILSSIFFRSSWKYRDRAYRYHLLDTGHVLENLTLALNSLTVTFNISYDFNDAEINKLIGVDEHKEAALSIVTIQSIEETGDASPPFKTLHSDILKASIVSDNEIEYPPIRELHEAGRIPPYRKTPEKINSDKSPLPEIWMDIEATGNTGSGTPYPECLFMRRSKRNFIDKKIDRNDFMMILDIIAGCPETIHGNFVNPDLLDISFFAEKIDGITSGLYTLDRTHGRFGIIKEGVFNERIAHTCLNQEWLKNAGLHFLFICDLDELDKKYGPRGYRYAMMEAGMFGQLLYITATSLNLGCCGIGAFYDDEAMNLLGLERDSRLLYLVAVGNIKA